MLKLIKYEFIKKYKLIFITLIISLALNLVAITKGAGGSAIFLGLFPMVMSVFYIVDIIKMYSDDLNKKSGYMLFMTPNSGYKIIVSKILAAIIEGFTLLLLYFFMILINGFYIVYSAEANISISEILEVINSFLTGNFGIDLFHIFILLLTALIFLIGFITTVYTAMTIRKSLFSEVKFGGAISFVIFLILNWAILYVSGLFYEFLFTWYEPSVIFSSPSRVQLTYLALLTNIPSIIQSILLTFSSGYLLEKKINL